MLCLAWQVEPTNEDGIHYAMTVPYVVMERGIHQMPDGTWLVADDVDTDAVQQGIGVSGTPSWHTLTFPNQPTASSGGSADIEYGYDRNGNRIQQTTTGTAVTDYAYTAASNRMTGYTGAQSASVTTDLNGNITAIGSRTYSHNAANRIVSVLDGGSSTATYRYNGLGQRIEKVANQATTAYAYSTAGQLLGEYQPNGAMIREYVYLNGEPLVQIEPIGAAHEILYLQTDHLGTPRLATDSAGTAVWSWGSDPFGAASADTDVDGDGTHVTVNLRFPGQYYDQETGLHYNYFRYYDPSTGRYITSDPIGLQGGFNTFTYAGDNPISYIDPLGLFLTSVDAACIQSPELCVELGMQIASNASSIQEKQSCNNDGGAAGFENDSYLPTVLLTISGLKNPLKTLLTRWRSAKWVVPRNVTNKFPSSWGAGKSNKKTIGTRWHDPNNKGNGVRIDKGISSHRFASQRVDHVIVRRNGKIIGRDGSPIHGSIKQNADQAHIPLSEYQKWSKWYLP